MSSDAAERADAARQDAIDAAAQAQAAADAAAQAQASGDAVAQAQAAADAARAELEALRLTLIEAQLGAILADYPAVSAEIIGEVVVLTGTVETNIAKAELDQAVRATGLGVQNTVAVGDSPQQYSLLELIDAQPELSTLRSLVELAGLSTMLTDRSPITIFAPTNDAFRAMGPAFGEVRADPERLRAFLLSHMVFVDASLTELTLQPYESLSDGSSVIVSGTANGFIVNDVAPVLISDVRAIAGFMHIVARPIVAG